MYIIWRQTVDENGRTQEREFLCTYEVAPCWQIFRLAVCEGEIAIFNSREQAWDALDDMRKALDKDTNKVWLSDLIKLD